MMLWGPRYYILGRRKIFGGSEEVDAGLRQPTPNGQPL